MAWVKMGEWDALLSSIGASPAEWTSPVQPDSAEPEWKVELRSRGVEVSASDIVLDPGTGFFTYEGQQVLIYIKDTRRTSDDLQQKEEAVRFHFSDCSTIGMMKEENRYSRYVAIARTDSRFPVFSREIDGSRQELEVELMVCKNCLRGSNYRRYADETTRVRNRIWREFSIPGFFEEFSSRISVIPRLSCATLPPADYTQDWGKVSYEVRARANWICAKCKVDLSDARACLHVHHRDRDRGNNRWMNLVALCILCHAAEPGHGRMHISLEQRRKVESRRR